MNHPAEPLRGTATQGAVGPGEGVPLRPPGSPLTVLVCALGGEGGGVLTEWLYDAAVRAGHAAQCTSVPGVAQRTGATTYYIELAPEPSTAGVRRPVFSLNPVPGAVDLLVSSELLETVRQVGQGLTHPGRTHVVSSTARALTVAEKMGQGDSRRDSAALVAALQAHCRSADLLDLDALAREAGTAISAVLLGAVAASGALPLPRGAYEAAIRQAGKGVEPSLRGFALAYDAVTRQRAQREQLARWLPAEPAGLPDLRALARERLARYQDARYAVLYDERLQRLAAAGAAHGAGHETVLAALDEATRWLALWMMFDDIVHVAGLKLARQRMERVRREVKAKDDEIVRVIDHFKPGVPELAGLLPEPLARRLQAWDRRRVAAGRDPWALPLALGSHTVVGALALRAVASLKPLRRRGSRFAREQALIERWLSATARGLSASPVLGLELARCGRLVKGYGSTNERGKDNLLHILEHLAGEDRPVEQRVRAVREAREAALADEAGTALDRTLTAHGAPARPPREQVVRWYRRRPSAGVAAEGPHAG
jgi:indolepyruvate ferredoxin oxidoreductase beta subunit